MDDDQHTAYYERMAAHRDELSAAGFLLRSSPEVKEAIVWVVLVVILVLWGATA